MADLVRLIAIYNLGGIYLDVDCHIDQSLPTQLGGDITLFQERVRAVERLGPREDKSACRTQRIANFAFFARSPRSPFVRDCIIEATRRINRLLVIEGQERIEEHADILWASGPDVITSVYHDRGATNDYGDVRVIDGALVGHQSAGSWR